MALAVNEVSGLHKALESALGEDNPLCRNILSLAVFQAITGDAAYMCESCLQTQVLPCNSRLSSPRISELSGEISSRSNLWDDMCHSLLSTLYKGDLIALDNTRVNCNGKHISLAAVGKSQYNADTSQISASSCSTIRKECC